VEIAEKIFGPDVSELKGKSTRRKPKIVKYDVIAIPHELKQRLLELAIDIMFNNSIPMLTTIDKTIKFRSLIILNFRKAKDLYKGLDVVLRLYNGCSFIISRILCDGEFEPLMEDVKDKNMDVTLNFTAAGEHVPGAECNNKTI
jgi:phosphorylcholine metabolism protein LicD